MPTISTPGRRLALSLLLLAPSGCGDGTTPVDSLPRVAVAGSVTLDGQPLAQGMIQFNPVGGQEGATAVASGTITDGKYAIDRTLGPVPGKYKVAITSRPAIKIGPGEEPGTVPKAVPEKVPAQYNTKSTLEKEITADSVNSLDFDLKGK